MKAIINGKIIKENQILENQAIIFDDKIVDFISEQDLHNYIEKFHDKNSKFEICDAKNNFVSPGLIDIHIHGSGGCGCSI